MDIEPSGMATGEVVERFLAYCRRRELSPKTIDFYEWCLAKLITCSPEWPAGAEQVAAAWGSPTLGRVSRGDVERGIRAFLSWAEKNHGYPNALQGIKKMAKAKPCRGCCVRTKRLQSGRPATPPRRGLWWASCWTRASAWESWPGFAGATSGTAT